MEYRKDGFLPHAVLNYLVRLGWSHGDQEIFSMAELIALFSADDVNHSASRFDVSKLTWLNHHYIKTLPPEEIETEFRWHLQQAGLGDLAGPSPHDLIVALRERCATLKDMVTSASVWFKPIAGYDEAALTKQANPVSIAALENLRSKLASSETFTPQSIHALLEATLAELAIGMGKMGPLVRIAITGSTTSPSLDQTIYLAGKTQALARIDALLARLQA
jgi:glutamyl-tRNA synthetase